MNRGLRIALVAVGSLAALVLVVPLLWPVTPLKGTVPPSELASEASRFAEIEGVTYHYLDSGPPDADCAIVLLHGFGASSFSWREVYPGLSDRCRTVVIDRPPFGLTERPLPPYSDGNPYSPQTSAEHVVKLMDRLGIDTAVLVGHSAGAPVAVKAATTFPQRVEALVLEAPAVYETRGTPGFVSALLRSPQMRRIGPLLVRRIAGPNADDFIRSAYHPSFEVTPGVIAGYRLPLKASDWDKGLWELVAAPREESSADLLGELNLPTLVMAGRQDTFVPFGNSRRVAEEVQGAGFLAYDDTGHLPHEERPEQFVTDVLRFLDTLPSEGG